MNKGDAFYKIQKALSEIRQDDVLFPKVMVEAQQPAAETDPDYAVNNYPRLLQLVRAGLVPEEMISKMTNILKDPRRFGVSPKVRDELYTIMIKTLNYIVVSDPAAWARFRQYLLNTQVESTQMKSDIFFKFKKALHEESDKIFTTVAASKVRRLAEDGGSTDTSSATKDTPDPYSKERSVKRKDPRKVVTGQGRKNYEPGETQEIGNGYFGAKFKKGINVKYFNNIESAEEYARTGKVVGKVFHGRDVKNSKENKVSAVTAATARTAGKSRNLDVVAGLLGDVKTIGIKKEMKKNNETGKLVETGKLIASSASLLDVLVRSGTSSPEDLKNIHDKLKAGESPTSKEFVDALGKSGVEKEADKKNLCIRKPEFCDAEKTKEIKEKVGSLLPIPSTGGNNEKREEGSGVPRIQMPNFIPKMPNHVEMALQEIIEGKAKIGGKTYQAKVTKGRSKDPDDLKNTQSDIYMDKVAGMLGVLAKGISPWVRGSAIEVNEDNTTVELDTALVMSRSKEICENLNNPNDAPVIISNDGHILDGHHRWATIKALNEIMKDSGNEKCQMNNITEVDLPITDLLLAMTGTSTAVVVDGNDSVFKPEIDKDGTATGRYHVIGIGKPQDQVETDLRARRIAAINSGEDQEVLLPILEKDGTAKLTVKETNEKSPDYNKEVTKEFKWQWNKKNKSPDFVGTAIQQDQKEARQFETTNTLAETLLSSIRNIITEEISRSR